MPEKSILTVMQMLKAQWLSRDRKKRPQHARQRTGFDARRVKMIEQRPVVDPGTTGSDNNTNQYVLHRQHPAGEMLQRGNPAPG